MSSLCINILSAACNSYLILGSSTFAIVIGAFVVGSSFVVDIAKIIAISIASIIFIEEGVAFD